MMHEGGTSGAACSRGKTVEGVFACAAETDIVLARAFQAETYSRHNTVLVAVDNLRKDSQLALEPLDGKNDCP